VSRRVPRPGCAGAQLRATPHWLIAHKADPAWVEAAADMLERTYANFFDQFRKAEYGGVTYVQGLSLFRFMMRERPAQLEAYVAALSDRPRPVRGPREALAAFEGAFGPVDDFEKAWQQWIARGEGTEPPDAPPPP